MRHGLLSAVLVVMFLPSVARAQDPPPPPQPMAKLQIGAGSLGFTQFHITPSDSQAQSIDSGWLQVNGEIWFAF